MRACPISYPLLRKAKIASIWVLKKINKLTISNLKSIIIAESFTIRAMSVQTKVLSVIECMTLELEIKMDSSSLKKWLSTLLHKKFRKRETQSFNKNSAKIHKVKYMVNYHPKFPMEILCWAKLLALHRGLYPNLSYKKIMIFIKLGLLMSSRRVRKTRIAQEVEKINLLLRRPCKANLVV